MYDPKKFLFLLPFSAVFCSLKYAKERWKLKRWHESYALKKWKIARRIDRATSKEKRSDWCGTHAHMLNLYKTGNVRAREPQTQSANWQLILLNCSIARVWCLYLHFTINQSQFLLCIPISNVPIIYKYDRSPSNNIGPHSHPQRNKYKRLHVPIEETVKFDHCIYITFFFNSLLLLFLPHSQIIIQACSCFNQSSKQEFLNSLSLSFPFFFSFGSCYYDMEF